MRVGRSELIRILSDIKRRPLTDNQMRTLVESLWRDVDPNPVRIEIAMTNNPKIENYQLNLPDGTNLAHNYGDKPKVKLFQTDEFGNIIERSERPYFQMVDGLIDVITFNFLDIESNWLIEISR